MIAWERACPSPPVLFSNRSFRGPFFCGFLWSTKKPRQRRSLYSEEHVQESVLVSTLKRRSALLTQIQTTDGESIVSPCLVALSTGTVTVGLNGGRGSPAGGSEHCWRGVWLVAALFVAVMLVPWAKAVVRSAASVLPTAGTLNVGCGCWPARAAGSPGIDARSIGGSMGDPDKPGVSRPSPAPAAEPRTRWDRGELVMEPAPPGVVPVAGGRGLRASARCRMA